jgi:hypothetical protein
MYPHERSLVKKFAGKPFALLGVNSDRDRAELQDIVDKEKITWRSWWDGGSMQGPIAKKWNIQSWPTIYVLDRHGVIRYKDLRDVELEKAVGSLLKELEDAEAGKKSSR